MSLDARFARLNIDYDRPRAFREAESLVPRLEWTRSAPPLYMYGTAPFTVGGSGGAIVDPMATGYTWKSMGLTHIHGNETSKLGRGSVRNRCSHEKWVWRDDVDTPYLRSLIESLPFERVTCVRLIVLPEGNVGTVHHDNPSLSYYFSGGRSLTLNLSSGGSALEFMQHGEHYAIGDHPAFIFRDDCWHGVPKVESIRIQLRVNGFFKAEMANLIDRNKVLQ